MINDQEKFLEEFKSLLKHSVDPDFIDEKKYIGPSLRKALIDVGAFSMKIPSEYDGQGLSSLQFSKALMMCGAKCGSISAVLLASQSIGLPAFLLKYGNQDQKEKYLPRFSYGSSSALALTESHAGSNPKNITSSISKDQSGNLILNGKKIWSTNSLRADLIVVIAKSSEDEFKAIIVRSDYSGVSKESKCEFSGLRGSESAVLKFDNVKIPKENIISPETCGIKMALEVLCESRIFLSAICVGAAKQLLKESREWGSRRCQWSKYIGEHELISDKITDMARKTFAMESMVLYSSLIMDRKDAEIKEESTMTKIYCTESCWEIVNQAMQIRGGRGYEKSKSLKLRGEKASSVERLFRDLRINLILEGSSEVLNILLAKEAFGKKFGFKKFDQINTNDKNLKSKIKFINKINRKLSRCILFSKIRYRESVKDMQLLLYRISQIRIQLFVLYTCVYRCSKDGDDQSSKILESIFYDSKKKIKSHFHSIKNNRDQKDFNLGQEIFMEKHRQLEELK